MWSSLATASRLTTFGKTAHTRNAVTCKQSQAIGFRSSQDEPNQRAISHECAVMTCDTHALFNKDWQLCLPCDATAAKTALSTISDISYTLQSPIYLSHPHPVTGLEITPPSFLSPFHYQQATASLPSYWGKMRGRVTGSLEYRRQDRMSILAIHNKQLWAQQ